ncbi:MAG TPA: hypothetical protein VGV39_11855 [Mesorhizobium sp.]|jgi:hypothetical protein|uniref:hypothetical protein n=1 Tax=Mesorhizobium sp. TaxID=1871066 RepID=UPI002DDDA46E|nr:hypothetical protein [Mesorhizobium sp.]HEV2503763.1 hypothetical protein [Mesorhizobium sp.]
MATAFSSTSGIAYPDDLKLLKTIYDDICVERGFHCGSHAAEDLAKAMMDLFTQGVVEESEVRDTVAAYLGRSSPAAKLLREQRNEP